MVLNVKESRPATLSKIGIKLAQEGEKLKVPD